ncbi:MAG: hypothetical protein OEZ48_00150 [Candidatus Bathyarchaeota archaeon]|nr:hypothetical protein [Candidatus Bathyarchaeota archaeon]MDH5686267.1 hypothetical protein [Candidatus Bathyarchaeota archaeon]
MAARLRNWFLRKFDIAETSEKAGISWLAVAGLLGDRMAAMDNLNTEEEFLDWSVSFFRAALPWFRGKNDARMMKKVISWLDTHEIYETKIKPYHEEKREIPQIVPDVSKFPTREMPFPGINPGEGDGDEQANQDVYHLYYTPDFRYLQIGRSDDRWKKFLIEDAKVLLTESFADKDLAKSATFVVSKSEIPGEAKSHPGDSGMDMVGERIQELESELEKLKRQKARG